MHRNTSSRAKFFKIQYLDMKSNFCQRNKLQLKYFVQARFSNTGPFFWATRYSRVEQHPDSVGMNPNLIRKIILEGSTEDTR